MKIVQLITRMDTIGGAQVHVRDLSIRLQEAGHAIHLVTGGEEHTHELLEQRQIRPIYCKHLMHKLHILSDVKAIFEVRNLLKTIRPDLVATHSSKAGIIGRIAGWSLGIPTVFTAHGWSFTDGIPKNKQRLYRWIEKMIGFITDGVIAVSSYDKRLALEYAIVPERKIVAIPNGVHDAAYTGRVRSKEDVPIISMVARFSPQKNQAQLLQVLKQLDQLKWKLFFAGDGPLLPEAKQFVAQENLTDRVVFLGDHGDIQELLQQSDLFVLVSEWEGLPLSILEAMRSGLPIVASDVGGVREAVRQSVNGFIVKKNDVRDLQDKLRLLIEDATLRQEMGEESRRLYEERFTFERMYEDTIAYYNQVLGQGEKTGT
ncbi:glycosyltransferase family 4 protein [Sporosarcina sp. 179-K 3D1 HS]|uniref:glycosyltransferase family 4 protein n=1 Tax=Sporosarcina sp. 179-K 3D1 HS TaxID=3232169 RepID=UPI0039A0A084